MISLLSCTCRVYEVVSRLCMSLHFICTDLHYVHKICILQIFSSPEPSAPGELL